MNNKININFSLLINNALFNNKGLLSNNKNNKLAAY